MWPLGSGVDAVKRALDTPLGRCRAVAIGLRQPEANTPRRITVILTRLERHLQQASEMVLEVYARVLGSGD